MKMSGLTLIFPKDENKRERERERERERKQRLQDLPKFTCKLVSENSNPVF